MLRDRDDQNLREHLIAVAARLIDQRGSAGLAVRDIAREAQVADGALYNYFEDKEDLLAQALMAHVGMVMHDAAADAARRVPGPSPENLALFIDRGLAMLQRVVPAFAGLLAQPKVLHRFHAMVGGDAAFGAPAGEASPAEPRSAGRGRPGCRTCSPGTCTTSSSSAGSTRPLTSTRPPR